MARPRKTAVSDTDRASAERIMADPVFATVRERLEGKYFDEFISSASSDVQAREQLYVKATLLRDIVNELEAIYYGEDDNSSFTVLKHS